MERGEKVVVVEDLISTAGSCVEVVETLREAGAEVLGVISIFTYGMEKGKRRLEEAGIEAHSLTDIATLLDVAVNQGYITSSQKTEVENFIQSL